MEQSPSQRWWALHRRVACGEALDVQEQACYRAGLDQFERDEVLQDAKGTLKDLRARVAALEAEHHALVARRREVEAEIAVLETTLGEHNRQLLGAED